MVEILLVCFTILAVLVTGLMCVVVPKLIMDELKDWSK